MNPLATLVIIAAALVLLGQWVSLRARASLPGVRLTPRLDARLDWWGSHRAVVAGTCVAVAAGGLAGGLLL